MGGNILNRIIKFCVTATTSPTLPVSHSKPLDVNGLDKT